MNIQNTKFSFQGYLIDLIFMMFWFIQKVNLTCNLVLQKFAVTIISNCLKVLLII